ncbi:hypothetical protein [Bacteroides caecimuris]|uniref:hypothetical protein n=1 Tax=Bacteroides caecimuris TaxID=1796613 RepID=UPI00138F52F6|nr:hypothetical protein [Bacteroides caecimuris]NDO59725.1 hypothetical protein [Bacteroides caecimuris]
MIAILFIVVIPIIVLGLYVFYAERNRIRKIQNASFEKKVAEGPTDLNVIRQYIRDGKLEEAFLLLRRVSSNNPLEYAQLKSFCKKSLSEQYLYLLKEHIQEKDAIKAEEILQKYYRILGHDEKIDIWKKTVNNLFSPYQRVKNIININMQGIPTFIRIPVLLYFLVFLLSIFAFWIHVVISFFD